MWTPRYVASAALWHFGRVCTLAAARIWLNRAWLRSGNCLVADLEAIERHQGKDRVPLEPPYLVGGDQ